MKSKEKKEEKREKEDLFCPSVNHMTNFVLNKQHITV
jgi:hypothetical protein